MFGKIITGSMVISGILLFFIFSSFSPTTGPGIILSVFFLLYIFFFGVIVWALIGASWLMKNFGGRIIRPRRPIELIKTTDAAYYSSIIAMAPVMLVAMNSVGDVSAYEIILVLLFVAIGAFYIKKRLG